MDRWNFTHDEFFQDLVARVNEIISELNPNGIIRIPEYMITKLGYHNKQDLEEEFLHKAYVKVARFLGIDLEIF